MSIFMWIVVALFALGALSTVYSVDKPRPRITPGLAVMVVVIDAILIAGILIDQGVL